MTQGLFITGTDTGVGKTHVAALILRQMVAEGLDVVPFKPACSGATVDDQGRPQWDDLQRLRSAVSNDVTEDDLCPQRFLPPLAPPIAARQEGRSVDVAAIDAALARLGRQHQHVVIEGAGGWLCPLTETWSFADWVARRNCPVLIVARPGLGTINHTLLTVESIRRHRLTVAGVVLNATNSDSIDDSTVDNAAEIEARSGVPVLGHVEHHGGELLQGGRPVRIRWPTLMNPVRC